MRRIFCVLLLTAATGLAQDAFKIGSKVDSEEVKKLALQLKSLESMRTQLASKCAIPLLQAAPPNADDAKIKQVVPDTAKLAPMPQYKGLPACESK